MFAPGMPRGAEDAISKAKISIIITAKGILILDKNEIFATSLLAFDDASSSNQY